MSESIPQKAVARTADRLLGEVYPGLGAVPRAACRALFMAVVRTGRTLVRDIARTMHDGSACMKGLQEKVSGWLGRYDFLSGAARWLWRESARWTRTWRTRRGAESGSRPPPARPSPP